jgi:hypothetical protein
MIPSEINSPSAEIRYLHYFYYYYHWVDTSADGLLISEGIIHPVDRASVVARFIRYLHYYYYYYHWVDTSADGLLISEGIIHPVDRASESNKPCHHRSPVYWVDDTLGD